MLAIHGHVLLARIQLSVEVQGHFYLTRTRVSKFGFDGKHF